MAGLALVNLDQQLCDAFAPGWMLWLGLALLGLLFSGAWRVNDPRLKASPRQWEYVPILALCSFATFVAWLLPQFLFIILVHPTPGKDDARPLSDREAVLLSVLAPAVGWLVGVSLLRGSRAVQVVGYSLRRLPAGVFEGIPGIALAMPFVFVAFTVMQTIWIRYTHSPLTEHQLLHAIKESHSAWTDVAATAAAVVIAPMFEELLFRGYVQGTLRRLFNSRIIAVFITSALFAVIHDHWTIPPIFVLSLFLGFAYERKGNLWTSTTMHAMFNLFNIITSRMG